MPEPDRSLDLFFEELVEGRLSRRQVIARLGAAGLTFSSAGTLLAACGGVKGTNKKDATKAASATHAKTAIAELDFSNWPLYIDKKVLKDFEKANPGANVKYTEEINDNEEFFGKVRQQLQRGDSLGRDIVVLTDWMASRWIRGGWVEPKDKKNIPNEKNLQPGLQHPKFDPTRSYTLPWQSGMTAIGYNPKKTGREITSINDLFDPKFKGKVSMLSDPRDSAGLVAIAEGKKLDAITLDDMLAAIDKIDQQNKSGQIRRFTGNDYTTDLAKGNLWLAVAYSGDLIQLQADNPDLKFVIPQEGAILWTDNMLMPEKPPHPYAAETMMNYVYDPVVAAKIAAYVNYVTPVVGAQQELAKTDPKLANNPLIFPSDADRAKLQGYPQLSPADENKMVQAMQKVTGA
jgi:spermidine/putrescine transport system substrate-binding protein